MTAEQWIESASREHKPLVGDNFMVRDAILTLPPTERQAALEELHRARRCVLRFAFDHADEVLETLGLDPLTDAEKAAAPPKPVPAPRVKPKPSRRGTRASDLQPTHKQCTDCKEPKPLSEFDGRSYRCHTCTRQALAALERERVRDVDALAAEAFPAGSTRLVNTRTGQDNA